LWRRPWRRGGPARTSGSRWRPKPIRLRFSFGLQEQASLKRTPRLHTESDLGALGMDGKIISRRFQWLWFQAQIHPESTGIVCGSWRPESVPVLRHCFWADGPCIVLEPNRGLSRGPSTTLGSSLTATATSVGFGFCLDSFYQEQLSPFICRVTSFELRSFEFLLVFFVALAGISLLGEVNRVVTRLITRGVVVLRLLDSGLRI